MVNGYIQFLKVDAQQGTDLNEELPKKSQNRKNHQTTKAADKHVNMSKSQFLLLHRSTWSITVPKYVHFLNIEVSAPPSSIHLFIRISCGLKLTSNSYHRH